jgi:ADP-dependent phosphofructokinase/glucokinase
MCVHSSKFAFSVSKYDVKKELEALEAATLIAGLRVSDKISLRKEPILKKKLGKYNLCIVPSFFNPYPKRITGVGDTFAAVQAVKILS